MLWYAFLWKMQPENLLWVKPSCPVNHQIFTWQMYARPGKRKQHQLSIAIFGYQRLPYMATPPQRRGNIVDHLLHRVLNVSLRRV